MESSVLATATMRAPTRNSVSPQPARVAGPIEILVMCKSDAGCVHQEGYLGTHLITPIAVLTHDRHFSRIERAGFPQNVIGDSHFSYVVQESTACNHAYPLLRNVHGPGDRNRIRSYTLRMPSVRAFLEIERLTQGIERDVI